MIDTAPTVPAPSALPLDTICVRFPRGLLGFPDVKEFELSAGPGDGLFWLSGAAPDSACFLLSDPFVYFEGFSVDLSPGQVGQIEAGEAAQVAVLAVTVPHSEGLWTANLQGPVVINFDKHVGAQVVLGDRSLGVRAEFQPRLVRRSSPPRP